MVLQVKSTGSKLEDDFASCFSLPESDNTIVTAIETLSDEKIIVDFVKNRLPNEDLKHEESFNKISIS